MTHELDLRIVHVLGLLALTGCGSGQVPADPEHEGSYGSCDPAVIDALATSSPQLDPGEEAEMLACDSTETSSQAECEGWDGEPSTIFADDVGDGNTAVELVCGYMWLDGLCCADVWVQGDSADTGGPDVGRPLLVGGAARKAGLAPRPEWVQPSAAAAVPPALQEALVGHWARAGLAEHASVAAFARFSMALLHLGAPPELVEDAHRAALDEVRHARLCFGLASRYAGTAIGPGRLDLDASLDGELEPVRVFETLFKEGCVGETLAALEAAHAARRAVDPAVRDVLEAIAEDEQRHAALAWRAAEWLLERYPATRSRLASLAAALVPSPVGDSHDDLAPHGCLGAAERQRVRSLGVAEVVLPLVRGLHTAADAVAA